MSTAPSISLLGTTALLFEAPGGMNLPSQQRIWALAREAERWPEVREAVPGMNNLMLSFTRAPRQLDALRTRLCEAWDAATALPREGRIVVLRRGIVAGERNIADTNHEEVVRLMVGG